MQLLVGRRPVRLPPRRCEAECVRRAVERINPPFVVVAGRDSRDGETPSGFSVRRRVFFEAEDARVECESDGELALACKLMAEGHNRWDEFGDPHARAHTDDTRRMELAAAAHMEEAESSDDDADGARSEEDISIEEWGQMGYKWFRREDVSYI